MSMRVEMTFNKDAVIEKGYSLEKIYSAIKAAFAEDGLPCVSDGEVLAFADKGREEDWGSMWFTMTELLEAPWFIETATSLLFIEDGTAEDVLSQAEKL